MCFVFLNISFTRTAREKNFDKRTDHESDCHVKLQLDREPEVLIVWFLAERIVDTSPNASTQNRINNYSVLSAIKAVLYKFSERTHLINIINKEK